MSVQLFTTKRFSIWERIKGAKHYEYVAVNNVSESVMVLPFLPDGRLLMIKKYCAASDTKEIVFPGGAVEKGEGLGKTAIRELQEETGYMAREIIEGGALQILPGYLVGKTYWVIAKGLEKTSGGIVDIQEVDGLEMYSTEEVKFMIKNGEITDSRTIASFLSYLTFYHEKSY